MGWRTVVGAQVECDFPQCDARENTVVYGYPDGSGGTRYHEAECPPGWARGTQVDYEDGHPWRSYLCPAHAQPVRRPAPGETP